MQTTVLHIITVSSSRAGRTLKRLLLADRGLGASRQVVISLADSGVSANSLRAAGVEVHGLGLEKLSRLPAAFLRLVILIRNIRPDVVMTWLYHAHFIGTLAAITSGVGTSRVVWNLRYSKLRFANYTRTTRWLVILLAWLSPLPFAIASSHSGQRAHQSLGYRARRWVRLPNGTKALESYRQLWRVASVVEPPPVDGRKRHSARLSFYPLLPEYIRRRQRRLKRLSGQFRYRWRRRFAWVSQWLKFWWAQLRRLWLTNTIFIAVTGSCGKTTATKLVGAVLSTQGRCQLGCGDNLIRHSVATLLSVNSSSKYCVQEVTAYPLGEIAKHVRVLRPQIAIVTTIGTDHYKAFRSLEATAREKGQLVERLPKDGIAILNADDPHVRAMAMRTRARIVFFGRSADAEIRATEVSSVWPDCLKLTVVRGHETVHIQTRLVGEHWTTAVLAAVACGITCGLGLQACADAIARCKPGFGRCSVHSRDNGPIFVCDTFKAPLWTIAVGLAFVAKAQAPRKTMVFGTISDCPGAGSAKYRRVAREALEVADRVLFVGPNAGYVSKLLRQGELRDRLFTFQSSYQASAFLAEEVAPRELIYIKASKTDHLERIMLSQIEQVVCWRERCGVWLSCKACRSYRKPHAPPFGLAKMGSPVLALSPGMRTGLR